MTIRLGQFRCDVTPPLGHPLCGGWIPAASRVADRLWAKGTVLAAEDQLPIALVAVDWCEIRNHGWDEWRYGIAGAIGTAPDRVTVHCVHPHDAPFADPEAERLLREHEAGSSSLDRDFFYSALARVAEAAATAMPDAQPVTHLGTGSAAVSQVASNRRILGPDGKVAATRWSSCRDEALRAEPEGLADPLLRTLSFWSGDRLLAALHYYAVHPMSHYGRGEVSSDFCGLAREAVEANHGGIHLYFTGCAGNLTAGKYNDGSPQMRPILEERIRTGMEGALATTLPEPLERLSWHVRPACLPTRPEFTEGYYRQLLDDGSASHLDRYRGATGLSWLRRSVAGHAIPFSCLTLNEARVLHLPGEPFVEYQLFAHACRPDDFVAVAGYGDCGPGYIPTSQAFDEGGYEAGWAALVSREVQPVMEAAIRDLLDPRS